MPRNKGHKAEVVFFIEGSPLIQRMARKREREGEERENGLTPRKGHSNFSKASILFTLWCFLQSLNIHICLGSASSAHTEVHLISLSTAYKSIPLKLSHAFQMSGNPVSYYLI